MVKAYFTACEQAFPAQRAQLRRLSLALRRGGVERMEQLCAMQRAGPEGLLEIRSIGTKSLPLIEGKRQLQQRSRQKGTATQERWLFPFSCKRKVTAKKDGEKTPRETNPHWAP